LPLHNEPNFSFFKILITKFTTLYLKNKFYGEKTQNFQVIFNVFGEIMKFFFRKPLGGPITQNIPFQNDISIP
jgi:hypothetical protein